MLTAFLIALFLFYVCITVKVSLSLTELLTLFHFLMQPLNIHSGTFHRSAMIILKLEHPLLGIRTFEDKFIQIPAPFPTGQNCVQMPCLSAEFDGKFFCKWQDH